VVKKIFRVSDMHCSNCAMKIEGLEDDLPGIRSISASYQKGLMVVEFDETQISDALIVAAVQKQGYTATLLTPPEPHV
jgi:copper chaperone CopZ